MPQRTPRPSFMPVPSPRAPPVTMAPLEAIMTFVAPAPLLPRPAPLRLPSVFAENPRPAKSPRTNKHASAAPAPSPRLSTEVPLTVETFLLPRKLKAKQRVALLAARGLDQERAEELCNSHEIERSTDGTKTTFWALTPNGQSLCNMVGCVNWMAIAADTVGATGRRNPRGLALVQWADAETRVASTFFEKEPWFFDDNGDCVSAQAALDRVRTAGGGGRRTRVHQLVLLGGRGAGAALLRAIAGASGVNADDLLFVSAACMPSATKHLWVRVYQDRFGFTRVPSLRANMVDPHDDDEAYEVPLVVKVGDLRALYVARTEK